MADRVLPSREAFEGLQHEPMIDGHLPPGWRTVLREFGAGRLVDREAIDTICDEIWELGQASWPWRDAPTPAHDAALGVTDDG